MTQVTEADREVVSEILVNMPTFDDVVNAERIVANHRIQARKEALEELRSAIFTYAERATEAAQSGLQIAYSIANEVE